jgi:hypothetical protein
MATENQPTNRHHSPFHVFASNTTYMVTAGALHKEHLIRRIEGKNIQPVFQREDASIKLDQLNEPVGFCFTCNKRGTELPQRLLICLIEDVARASPPCGEPAGTHRNALFAAQRSTCYTAVHKFSGFLYELIGTEVPHSERH